jgi:DNA polymerase (family X)
VYSNDYIVDILEQTAALSELHSADEFKIRSYNSLAFGIDKYTVQLKDLSESEMAALPGLGKSNLQKVQEILNTGTLQYLEELRTSTPIGVQDMLQIKGLGPKKVKYLWQEAKIESLAVLLDMCHKNELIKHKGFGQKVQDSIKAAIEFYQSSEGGLLWAKAEQIVQKILPQLHQYFGDNNVQVTGTYRRQYEIVFYLSFAVIADVEKIQASLAGDKNWFAKHILHDTNLYYNYGDVEVVLYACTPQNFVERIIATTGSIDFEQALSALPNCKLAMQLCKSEVEVFEKLNLEFVHPAMRENAAIVELAANKKLPKLIQPADIRGVIHNHSTYSDGAASLLAMAEACIQRGYEYFVISDHSQYASYANGLSEERIIAQHQEIDVLNKELAPFKIFKSIECDILPDGQLDYDDEVLGTFDVVVASIHAVLNMDQEKATSRIISAIENPHTSILGHMTGRLLLQREGYPLDMKKVIDACAANDVAIELNASPKRLDIDWRWIHYALEKEILISINPDAHSTQGIDDIRYGVLAAQKAGLTASQCLSAYSLASFEDWISAQVDKRGYY